MKICFVALGAYPLFDPTVRGPMGGMETRAWIFARALARRGRAQVSFVVDERGQPAVGEFGGITVYARRNSMATEIVEAARGVADDMKSLQRSGSGTIRRLIGLARCAAVRAIGVFKKIAGQVLRGVPSGPALYPRIPADVFLTFGVNGVSAEVVVSCRAHGKKSVLCIAHDSDLDEIFTTPTWLCRADGVRAIDGCRALRQADEIIVQSQDQLDILRERFGRQGHLIANPIDLFADDTEGAALEPQVRTLIRQGPYVLWVGRSDPVFKQPDVCLDLAERLPDVRFVMVMALLDANLHAEIRRRKPANVEIIDGLPFRAMPHAFRWAVALASTSRQEGFPNVFLQAGKYRVPVVSLSVDPDGLFSRRQAGIVCDGNVMQMAGELHRLAADPEYRALYASRLAQYVSENHSLAGRCDELCEVIDAAIRPAEGLPVRIIHPGEGICTPEGVPAISRLSRPTIRRWLALAVFLAALASYLVPLIRRGELSLPPAPGGDEPDYDAIAVQLAKGRGFAVDWDDEEYRGLYEKAERGGKPAKPQTSGGVPSDHDSPYAYLFDRHGASATAFRPPLLPALLSATYRIFGRQFAPIRVINCGCLALVCTLMFLFLFSRCGALPGLLAAALFLIVEPRLRLYPQAVLTECLGCLFATLCVSAAIVAVKRQTARWAIAAGLVTGLAILTRNVFAVWAPVMAIVIYTLARPREVRWLSLAAVRLPVTFAAACLLLLAPWMIRNCLLLESISPLGLQGAMGLSQGYSDKAVTERGEWFNPDDIGFYDCVRSGAGQSPLDLEKAMAAHSRSEAMKWIAEHPQLVPWLAFQKSCSVWRPTGRRDCFLFLFALSGIVGLWRIDRAAAIVVLSVMGANTAAVAMTFSGGDRFLIPLVPVLTGLSGLGVWTWIRGTTELELAPPVAAEAIDRIEYNLGAKVGEWPERLEAAWQMIDGLQLTESATVGDFGCGRQALRRRLPSSWSYVPFDRIARSEDTRICDFDSELPEGRFDVAVCLGLLEYVQDPLRVLSHFAGRSKWLLVSYCGGGTIHSRAREGWVNHLDYAAIERCVESAGGRIFAVEVDWHQRMWLFDCTRCGAGAQPGGSERLKEVA